MFAIDFDAVSPTGRDRPAVGSIHLGGFHERFESSLEYWSIADYRDHWRRALGHITTGSGRTALISSMGDPRQANFGRKPRHGPGFLPKFVRRRGPQRAATKYLAWGWWNTIATVDCSGWNWNPVDSSHWIPICAASSSLAVCSLPARSGHAG